MAAKVKTEQTTTTTKPITTNQLYLNMHLYKYGSVERHYSKAVQLGAIQLQVVQSRIPKCCAVFTVPLELCASLKSS